MSAAKTDKQVIYRGWLTDADWGEGLDILFLLPDRSMLERPEWDRHPSQQPLAKRIEQDMDEHGRYLSVRYWTTEIEKSPEELEHDLILWQVGEGDPNVGARYSDVTGYLWTDEQIRVGGHDLIEELHNHEGEFCHLEISYSLKEPR